MGTGGTTLKCYYRIKLQGDSQANQLKYEEGASGIEVIQTELDILFEEIIEKEKDAKQRLELGVGDKKKKEENEKLSAEDIRKQAMERMSQIARRKEEEGSGDSSGVKKKKEQDELK